MGVSTWIGPGAVRANKACQPALPRDSSRRRRLRLSIPFVFFAVSFSQPICGSGDILFSFWKGTPDAYLGPYGSSLRVPYLYASGLYELPHGLQPPLSGVLRSNDSNNSSSRHFSSIPADFFLFSVWLPSPPNFLAGWHLPLFFLFNGLPSNVPLQFMVHPGALTPLSALMHVDSALSNYHR